MTAQLATGPGREAQGHELSLILIAVLDDSGQLDAGGFEPIRHSPQLGLR